MLSFLLLLAFPVLQIAAYDNTQMLCLVNKERSKNGLQPLGLDSKLTQAAQQHSNDQARRRTMSHDGGDGSTPGQRVTRAGFKWKAVAENVAYGYKDEQECMKQWMNSPGHRKNILGSYEMFGSAVALTGSTPYYTQNFGTDSGGKRGVPKCDGTDYSNGDDNNQNNNSNGDDNNQNDSKNDNNQNDSPNDNKNNYGDDNTNKRNDNDGSNGNKSYGNRGSGKHGGQNGKRRGSYGSRGNDGSNGGYGSRGNNGSRGSYGRRRTWSYKY